MEGIQRTIELRQRKSAHMKREKKKEREKVCVCLFVCVGEEWKGGRRDGTQKWKKKNKKSRSKTSTFSYVSPMRVSQCPLKIDIVPWTLCLCCIVVFIPFEDQ